MNLIPDLTDPARLRQYRLDALFGFYRATVYAASRGRVRATRGSDGLLEEHLAAALAAAETTPMETDDAEAHLAQVWSVAFPDGEYDQDSVMLVKCAILLCQLSRGYEEEAFMVAARTSYLTARLLGKDGQEELEYLTGMAVAIAQDYPGAEELAQAIHEYVMDGFDSEALPWAELPGELRTMYLDAATSSLVDRDPGVRPHRAANA